MKLYIKNMVSIRCKMIVISELESMQLKFNKVELGHVELVEDILDEQRAALGSALLKYGLELLEDKKAILIERIKNVIIEMVHYSEALPLMKNSEYISQKLNHDYTYLANFFSEVTCGTIEHYIIMHKIEKVKELLVYNQLSLKEISYKLHYSSVAHLSAQFHKVTGLTTSQFKQLTNKRLQALDKVAGSPAAQA